MMVNEELSMIMPGTRIEVLGIFCTRHVPGHDAGTSYRRNSIRPIKRRPLILATTTR